MRRHDAMAVLLMALCLAMLFARLGSVPAMCSDEAWIYLFARRVPKLGFYTMHQMNRYSGPIFPYLVALCFRLFGVSMTSLRLVDPVFNSAALAGTWAHLRRSAGAQAAAYWTLLAAGSAYWLMKSRPAWDVYTFQPLLLCGCAWVLSRAERPRSAWALAALCWLGVQNHFIFLIVPASLVLLFGARAAWRGEPAAVPALRASAAALAAGAVLAAVKYSLSDDQWLAHRGWILCALLAAPAAATAAVAGIPSAPWDRALAFAAGPAARRWGQRSCLVGLVAFAIWHFVPMVQILAGPVVFKRLFSWAPPLPLSVCWHLWALFLCGLLAWFSARAWQDDGLSTHQRTLLLWPAALAAIFIGIRQTSSLRYYSIPFWLSLMSLGTAFSLLAKGDRSRVLGCAAAAALATQCLLWREIASPADRRPLEFKIGWRRESSWDFARKDELYAALDHSRACAVIPDGWAAGPLLFHRETTPGPCDASIEFGSRPTPAAAAPPYFESWVEPNGSYAAGFRH